MLSVRRLTTLFVAGGIMLMSPPRARQDGEMFQDRAITIGATQYHYRVFVPKGWSKKKKWPMILFLHGAGERGEDNLAQTRIGIGPAISRQAESFPFVTVLPQCPWSRWWTERDMQTLALSALDRAAKEFNGDASRTYLTGLSMGGYGSWYAAVSNPGRFAALAVVCGGVRPPPGLNLPASASPPPVAGDPYAAVAGKIGHTPVWVFHGSADRAVPVTESRKMVEALKASGGNVRYNEYEGVGHNSWDKAYAEPELFTWLLSQRR